MSVVLSLRAKLALCGSNIVLVDYLTSSYTHRRRIGARVQCDAYVRCICTVHVVRVRVRVRVRCVCGACVCGACAHVVLVWLGMWLGVWCVCACVVGCVVCVCA